MSEQEDKRLWWQKRLKILHDGCTVVTASKPGFVATVVCDKIRSGKDSLSELIDFGAARGAENAADDLAACFMLAEYRRANPTATLRFLLGLPAEDPPPKVMTKAEIAGEIRKLRGHLNYDDRFERLALAVEALPDAEPAKVGAFAEAVADWVRRGRSGSTHNFSKPIEAARGLQARFNAVLDDLLSHAEFGGDVSDDHDLRLKFAFLCADAQRAAEDLGLVEQ